MELKIRRIGNGYGIILPKVLLEELAVSEGSLLEAESHEGMLRMTPLDPEFSLQVEAYLRTEAQHRRSYRKLAK